MTDPKPKFRIGTDSFVSYSFHSFNSCLGNVKIRAKHLITILQVEAQYHYQEMRKYERELERLKE